jgi:4-amino-4-deoxy-L-arabinose transferase-like glycosyltransferase
MKKLVCKHPLAVLVVACALLYLPRAGSFGLWDPWETHYGEIARQMAMRGDVITPWWPCAPIDRPEVFHKPVLHFWLMAASLRLFGLEGAHASPSQMVDSWRPEWAARLPNLLLAILTIAIVFWCVSRLANRRAAWLTALVLATSSQWLLVARQAMTDMPFVAPMTIALCLAAVALLDEESCEAASPRLRRLALAGLLLVTLPQLILFSRQLHGVFLPLGKRVVQVPGVVAMLPYFVALPVTIYLCSRGRSHRALLLQTAWALTALATLAKGPAGLALPALTIFLFLALNGRVSEVLRLELPAGALVFTLIAAPWYHAMHVRHGMAFWRELIGDNYLNRATGRSGDRGTFEYYLPWIGYGTFPWCGLVAVGVLRAFATPRRALAAFALVWAVVDVATVTLVTTKFHHYIVPALPALAILAGLALEDFLAARVRPIELALIALPVVALCGRDLAQLPARLLWLFCYDYVLNATAGRPWPLEPRYDFHVAVTAFAVAAAVAMLALALAHGRARRVALVAAATVAIAWSYFLIDDFIPRLSPHWSQKSVIAAYYRARHDEHEPLVAWNLYWRGESFYSRNQLGRDPDPRERTEWAYIDVPKALREYLPRHRGQRIYFVVERAQLENLRSNLGPSLAESLQIVDTSNNKLYLVSVDN